MPYYAIFATPLSDFPFPIAPDDEYSAELRGETDDAALREAESQFQPFLLAVHYYATRERRLEGFRTIADYEAVARARLRAEEADLIQ